MSNTTNLQMPLLQAAQAQKHVTVNDTFQTLDSVVQLSVKDRNLTAPPGSPADGDRYIPAASATGAWASQDGNIAAWQDGAWNFYNPREGWRCWIDDEDKLLVHDGSGWNIDVTGGGATTLNGLSDVTLAAEADGHFLIRDDTAGVYENHVISGDVTIDKDGAATIANDGVSNAKMADMAAYTLKGRNAGTTGDPSDIDISGLTEKVTPVNADLVLIQDSAASNAFKKAQVGNLPGGGGGETNTVSNIGTAGVGVFKQKVGVDFELKKINAGSNKITITDDTGNDEIDIDVAEANVDHDALTNFVADEHVAHGGVAITAGNGLTGGGDISANRTLDVGAGTGIAVNADDVALSTNSRTRTLTFIIDGGGSAITTGIKGDLEIPFGCTIQQVTLLANQSGSIVVDIWKDTYPNFPPTDADSITASAPPTITSATKNQDSTLTGWTTAISAGDILRFNVDSVTSIQRLTLSLKVTTT